MINQYYTKSLRAYQKTLSKPVYIVETRCINTWEYVWTEGNEPMVFYNKKDAQSEIDDLLALMPDYSIDDYRIVEIIK